MLCHHFRHGLESKLSWITTYEDNTGILFATSRIVLMNLRFLVASHKRNANFRSSRGRRLAAQDPQLELWSILHQLACSPMRC